MRLREYIGRMSKALWRLSYINHPRHAEYCHARFSLGGRGREVTESVAVERLRVRAGRAESRQAWLRLSLQVQAIDPRRQPP